MTTVIAGQPLPLLSQWYNFPGGALTDLDGTPTIRITNIGTGGVTVGPTTSGVTHPGTGSYGYAWTPDAALAAGDYLVLWSGLKSSAPVAASETVTVLAAATTQATNTDPSGVWYATREDVKNAMDFKETSRANSLVDQALEAASRDVEALCHRRFYPVAATRYWDYPDGPARPWRLWLDDNELISVSAMSSGGVTIPPATGYLLEPNRSGPPYNRIEINLSGPSALGGGATTQRDVTITGLYGYRDSQTTTGTTTASLDDATDTVPVDGDASALLGVGSVLRVDGERMLVTGRRMTTTGQTLGGSGLDAKAATVLVAVASGAAFAPGEVILIDAERMMIDDIAGNSLIVKRAWDGTVLAAHTVGATVYAPRSLTVRRGALGTTAAVHASASPVYRWDAPGPVHELTVAEAQNILLQAQAGWLRVTGGSGGQKEATLAALAALREQVYDSHGRKARIRAV